jgi:hypothetical protein
MNNTPTCKNDLYGHLGEELAHTDRGRSRGVLRRVRAAYDFCHFEVAGGKTVRRDVDEVLAAIENGYEFVRAE